jgi:hypothetical protein
MLIMLNVLILTRRLAQIARLARGFRRNPKLPHHRTAKRSGSAHSLPDSCGKRRRSLLRDELFKPNILEQNSATWKLTLMHFAYMAHVDMA